MAQDMYAGTADTHEGKVFTVTGQDWDSITQSIGDEGVPVLTGDGVDLTLGLFGERAVRVGVHARVGHE